ncbi:hypothetical protein [Sphaerochaeta sp. PS]|uniref:hypothetical protein n=1 Tax=Sphaerochaeta sp. PS TaxID=3076336 RepID=UPI0028A3CE32|nr:hypothetical protein [Sphaerochaeta sp. PS]MDT4761814.1 hypothetical protein [Sphaerochaeta sp. PS]
MKLLATGTITFTEQYDPCLAMLTSEVLLVPCDSQGIPRIPLGSSPLTSRMVIIQGGIEQSGWTFTRTQQGVTSTVNSSGVVSVTAISSDNGYVEVTASKAGQASLLKKLVVSKVYQGETGSLASDFSIELSPRAFLVSSRGMVKDTQVITATCRKMNIVGSPSIGWVANGVQLSSATGETVVITIEASSMLSSFNLSCTVAGFGAKSVEVQGIPGGSARPMYMGLLTVAPTYTPEGPLFYSSELGGDYYLGTDMIPYWYNGISFTPDGLSYVPNYADIMSHAAAEALKVPNIIPVTSALYAYFDHMSVTNAYIDGLRTRVLKLAGGGSIQSEQYIENQLGFLLKADGTFNAINANLINAIISGSGIFKGTIESGPLTTTTESEAGTEIFFDAPTHWLSDDMYSACTLTTGEVLQNVTGSYKGKALSQATKLASGGRAKLGSASGSGTSNGAGGKSDGGGRENKAIPATIITYTIPANCTVLGYSLYLIRYGSPAASCMIYRNGSTLSASISVSGSTTYTGTIAVATGDVVTVVIRGGYGGYDSDFGYSVSDITGSGSVTAYSTIVGPGLTLKYTDSSFELIPLGIYSNSLTMTGYTQVLKYSKASAFINGVAGYPINELKTAEGTLTYNGITYQVTGVMKNSATAMTIFHENGSLNFILPNADPGNSGYYHASGSYAVISSVAGAEMMNINARQADTYSIGNIMRFMNIIGKNLIGENLNLGGMPGYACRAWVNFNGTGSVAIRASKNVSSITDSGMGVYRVNFSNPMKSVDYAVATSSRQDGDANENAYDLRVSRLAAITTGGVTVSHGYYTTSNVYADCLYGYVAIFE